MCVCVGGCLMRIRRPRGAGCARARARDGRAGQGRAGRLGIRPSPVPLTPTRPGLAPRGVYPPSQAIAFTPHLLARLRAPSPGPRYPPLHHPATSPRYTPPPLHPLRFTRRAGLCSRTSSSRCCGTSSPLGGRPGSSGCWPRGRWRRQARGRPGQRRPARSRWPARVCARWGTTEWVCACACVYALARACVCTCICVRMCVCARACLHARAYAGHAALQPPPYPQPPRAVLMSAPLRPKPQTSPRCLKNPGPPPSANPSTPTPRWC